MKINFREASTKRGIVMLVTGSIVLYRVVWGTGAGDVDALWARVEWWLGTGITVVGLLGLLPDAPPTLPPVEFQGRAEIGAPLDRDGVVAKQSSGDRAADQRLRVELPAGHRAGPEWDERREDDSRWNG